MLRTQNCRMAVVVVYLLAGLGMHETCHADDTSAAAVPQEFQLALSKYAQWRDALDSLQVVYTWEDTRIDSSLLGRNASNRTGQLNRTQLRWQDWWNDGDCQAMKAVTDVVDENATGPRTVTGRKHNTQYFAEFSPGEAAPYLLTAANIGEKKTLQLNEQMPLYPVYFAITGWFSSSFERMPIEFVGTRTIDGCLCVGITQESGARPILWLDLEHDGIPRLIEPGNHMTRWTWKCDEFEMTSNGHWFPKNGSFGFTDQRSCRFAVESVSVNQKMQRHDFDIPLVSKATYVRDMTTDGTKFEMVSAAEQSAYYSQAGAFSWWRIHVSLGMLLTSAGWLKLRRQSCSDAALMNN